MDRTDNKPWYASTARRQRKREDDLAFGGTIEGFPWIEKHALGAQRLRLDLLIENIRTVLIFDYSYQLHIKSQKGYGTPPAFHPSQPIVIPKTGPSKKSNTPTDAVTE